MKEAHPLCTRWKAEAAVWHEEVAQKAEETQQVEEEQQAAPSVSFKPTGLLSGEVALGKAKGKGKVHTLVHAPNACMSMVQCKVSVRSEIPFFGLMKVNPVLPPVC